MGDGALQEFQHYWRGQLSSSDVPVSKPRMPPVKALVPYLRRIDQSRIYTNYGPMVLSLTERLAAHFNVPTEQVATVSNATLAITLSLMSHDPPGGSLCLMPSWTFAATPHAAMMAGMTPFFIDVDEDWAMTPELATAALAVAPGKVGAAVPVAPFGQPIDVGAWEQWSADTGIPVVIDAAAAFDTVSPSSLLQVISLHATKILGAGEGALVIGSDVDRIRDIVRRTNFGFLGSRNASVPSTNAKMSEYHAAVGMASLDCWPETRQEFLKVGAVYADLLSGSNSITLQKGFGSEWISTTCVVDLGMPAAENISRSLLAESVSTRAWWGNGAHTQQAFARCPRAELPQTERLARSTLGLPFFVDLPVEQVRWLCRLLANFTQGQALGDPCSTF